MKAPDGMPECNDVHAWTDGSQYVTAWKPSPEELVKINLGEPVWLYIIGANMPPVLVTADYPFEPKPEGETL